MRHGAVKQQTAELSTKTQSDTDAFSKVLFDRSWRDRCFENRRKFSSVTTYLSQLLAHDIVRSAPANTPFDRAIPEPNEPLKTDLSRGPLLLDTLYGEGMHIDHFLFTNYSNSAQANKATFQLLNIQMNSKGGKFLSPKFCLLMHANKIATQMQPVLADRRNRDNGVLLLLTALFKAYHNKMVDLSSETDSAEKFVEARIKTVRMWHNIIVNDILNVTTLIKPKLTVELSQQRKKGDAIHAAFRCFHALALPEYTIQHGKTQTLEHLLSPKAVCPEFSIKGTTLTHSPNLTSWGKNWGIDWGVFYNNETCFTPSFSSDLVKQNLFGKDVLAGYTQGVSSTGTFAGLDKHVKKMLIDMAQHSSGSSFAPDMFNKGTPLIVSLLAEAYCTQKRTGKLGHIGSALVRETVKAEIKKSEHYLRTMFKKRWTALADAQVPNNFLELLIQVIPNSTSKDENIA